MSVPAPKFAGRAGMGDFDEEENFKKYKEQMDNGISVYSPGISILADLVCHAGVSVAGTQLL